ncbi:uncharacterized protein LOC118648253 [Monomorium pharaonis]|uniref:uncharacterized protein LOC105835923 n=1 Tax=Monomorium pharaonis TaxID=307658 RepID=UPI001745E22F|nr:uncharacterized protein LOC105835923 [Monomorium pharaonis]XP_036150463.1 uncharacterized protein LOC118648253 [Monomorium pharaonis]
MKMEEIHAPVDDNSLSIEHILRPITYTVWFMGVGIARPRKCSKIVTIIIRIIHLAMCTVFLKTFTEYMFTLSIDSVVEFFYIIDRMIFFVAAYYYIYHGIRQYDKWPELMDKMKELDRKIKKDTHMNDLPVKIMEAVAIFMTFVCCPLFPIVISLYYFLHSYNNSVINNLLYFFMIARSLINSFCFDVVVYVLYYRYQTINKVFGHLNNLSDAPLIAFKIRRIRELHNDICDLVIMINDIHGFHLLLCSTNSFFMVTSRLYAAFINTMNEDYNDMLIDYMTAIMYTMQFGLICWICTLACQEFGKTKIIMNTIALKCKSINFDKLKETRNQLSLETRPPLQDADSEQNYNWSNSHGWNYVVMENLLSKILDRDYVSDEINWFLIQLQQRRISFTACDFFEMSNNLFCSFVGVICTYLIIYIQLIQFPDA